MSAWILILVIFETLCLAFLIVYFSRQAREGLKSKASPESIPEETSKLNDATLEYVHMIVHELRSPLSVVKGAVDLLTHDDGTMVAEQKQILLNQINESSNSLLSLVNDLLDVSKLESGHFEIEPVFANINELLEQECNYFQSSYNLKKVNLSCKLDSMISNSSFDPDRIKQVVTNLLSNALKFTPSNGSVVVTSRREGPFVHIEICDSGEGISDDNKTLLFQKFSQGSNHTLIAEKGTGLGLYISKGIVVAHQGEIWVKDNSPKGACFCFKLPIK